MVQELSDDDFDIRKEFCDIMLAKIEQTPNLVGKIIKPVVHHEHDGKKFIKIFKLVTKESSRKKKFKK